MSREWFRHRGTLAGCSGPSQFSAGPSVGLSESQSPVESSHHLTPSRRLGAAGVGARGYIPPVW